MENDNKKSVELINSLIKKVETRRTKQELNEKIVEMLGNYTTTEIELMNKNDLDLGNFQINSGEILSILKFAKRDIIKNKFDDFLGKNNI